jgi:cyanophycinase
VGGDEFRSGCEEMDQAVLRATGAKQPRVLVVPTAAAHQGPTRAASNGVDYFSSLGARASPLMVLGPADANDECMVSTVDDTDVIYLTGGDSGHLLKILKGSLLLQRLKDALGQGAVLAGSSAGAMVLGSWMGIGGWAETLGLLDGIAVLPHHEGSEPDQVASRLQGAAPAGTAVLGIDAKTCCFGRPGSWRVLGPGAVTVYTHGGWRQYQSGQAVDLRSA